ncbi:alpha/beta fold hydrolase [Aneurinibacillus migulanus]|uniref:Alpha/beta hydrolase n=1 Tax=Aneurinibacillus migulanus TaxID=47500 RepID=A0A0D1XLZ9_ANEMI|nr:alpha/beta hydrolase [Aneurinibacillus migulanus]KIV55291.1 alpha/beta hydrolase [Aneurinibacillus migulanus]KON96718.1 alpha/beta hydrolase [Aneurinibacillus migulanus]MED0895668.1 alpha/beta hydrolase [Aneurinibacillus migulanus]SDK46016.1 non-heme chloroperoxidase [Aneurinibacillus migulanus]GED17472.1 non-heme chloroperoxidase [Aneurinibacillus migulanus]
MGYYVRVEPDVKIYVEDVNRGGRKPILFIHGWPANHKLFEYQFNILPAMGYRCIGVDIRGFGKSDKPWRDYSYDRLADDVRAVVDTLELQNFTLAGHSVGGAISVRYMARHKGYGVSKLALFGAAAPSLTQRPDFPYGLPKQDVNKLIQETYNDRPKMLEGFGDMFFFQHVTGPFSDWFFQLGLQAAGWSTAAVLASLRDESLFSDLGKINVPTLIFHGVHDKVCLFPLAVAQNKGIKNSMLVPFEYSGHGLMWEEHDKFNKQLAQFIG